MLLIARKARPSRSLRGHRDFGLLWAGQAVSRLGSQVTLLAIPLLAIGALGATTFEVGALSAAETLPFLLVGLPAGAWVDRLRRRRVLLVADAGRLVVLGSVPLAWAVDHLTLAHLFVAAFAAGVLTVFFDVGYQAYLPELVDRDLLVDGNARLAATDSAATVVGPGIAGVLIAAVGAAYAVLADAASYAVSLVTLAFIRAPDVRPEPSTPERTLRRDIAEGLRFVARDARLRAITACTGTGNLFNGVQGAVLILFMARELDFGDGTIGLVFAIGGLGTVAGALVAQPLARRFGIGPAIVWSIALSGLGPACVAAAAGRGAAALITVGWAITGATTLIYNINQVSLRQAVCPQRLQGRMNASVRFVVWGTLPLGGFLGGVLGSVLGLRPTLWIAAIGEAMAFLWLLPSPVPRLRTIPPPVDEDRAPVDVVTEPELGVIVEAPRP